MKYLNGPLGGLMGPYMSPWIRLKNVGDSTLTLASDDLIINFPSEQATHDN